MRLIVGTLRAPHRLRDAEEAWHKLVGAVGDPVAGMETTFENDASNTRDGGLAQAIPEIGPGYGDDERMRIVMPARFFDQQEQDQLLTLLHETCHVRLMLSTARPRALETIRLQAIEQTRRDGDPRGYQLAENDKFDTAQMYRHFIEEVMAERMLATSYPDWAERRTDKYLAMRRGSVNGMNRMVDELRCYGLLYELARNDLGVSMSRTDDQHDAFSAMADRLATRLETECADGPALLGHRDGLQADAIPDPPQTLAVDEVADQIMRLDLHRPDHA